MKIKNFITHVTAAASALAVSSAFSDNNIAFVLPSQNNMIAPRECARNSYGATRLKYQQENNEEQIETDDFDWRCTYHIYCR